MAIWYEVKKNERFNSSKSNNLPDWNVYYSRLANQEYQSYQLMWKYEQIHELIDTIEYDYPTFHLSMDCFWCEVVAGDLVLKEHEAAKWLNKDSSNDVEWLPADVTLIEKIKSSM